MNNTRNIALVIGCLLITFGGLVWLFWAMSSHHPYRHYPVQTEIENNVSFTGDLYVNSRSIRFIGLIHIWDDDQKTIIESKHYDLTYEGKWNYRHKVPQFIPKGGGTVYYEHEEHFRETHEDGTWTDYIFQF